MPFKRKTLTELREQNRVFLQTELKSVGSLLRFSNLSVIADVDAGMAHLHNAYLDYIALQATPFTATDEWLAAWGAMKSVYRKPPTPATAEYQISGNVGAFIPAGSLLNRSDGYQYRIGTDVTIGSTGTETIAITAVLSDIAIDVTGGGSAGNSPTGTALTLDRSFVGVVSTNIMSTPATGGADLESEESFRARILSAFQNPPQGGSDADYKKWALDVPGITRVWVRRRALGPGTVGVYIMCDGDDKTNNGFPVGTDGISRLEDWGAYKATGDQGRVADYIFPRQPVTALVWICSPIKRTVDITLSGLSDAPASIKTAIRDALNAVLFENGNPDGTGRVLLSDLNYAIGGVNGTTGYILESPVANIVLGVGELPVLGEVSYV
ncbi:baseplate J/gp47 family protein [Pectobacterium carotovorum subsp. carotovorum]|nr:baseplate J/gp47 family protein [Pectobacterium carotovorum]MCL6397209.1 baseplate J/gp47 family protein [Pectobacterium carotovorum subsp. carotovorum]